MKTKNIILSIIVLFISASLFAQSKETIKVWGNCEMCQKKIEGAAKEAGASQASWNTETKMLTVSFKEKKTTLSKIEEAIAGAGYDTQNVTASGDAYNKLPGCCQYDRKSSGVSSDVKACCKDGVCNGGKDCKCDNCKDGKCKDGKCENCKKGHDKGDHASADANGKCSASCCKKG